MDSPARKYRALDNQLKDAPYAQGHLFIQVENDIPTDEIMRPAFWAVVAPRLRPGYLIDIVSADYGLDMQVRVLTVGQGFATVRPRMMFETRDRLAEFADRQKAAAALNDESLIPPLPLDAAGGALYKVGHAPNGADKGFWLQLKETGAVIKKGLATKREAHLLAISHAKQAGIYIEPKPAEAPAEPVAA